MEINEIKKGINRYLKFIFGGGLSLVLNLIITYLLTEHFQLWHMLSFSIALGSETLFLFAYHSLITFKKKGKFIPFIILIIIISAMNWIAVYVLSVIIGIHYLISIIVSAGLISVINYILNSRLVFNG